jgi:polyvinyl alcohol dehydrogenase (cytochrome)
MRQYATCLALLSILGAASSIWAHDDDDDDDDRDWPMFNHDVRGTRHNAREDKLDRTSVGKLHIKWSFPTSGVVNGTPVVRGDRVYAGDGTGMFYALDRHGKLRWKTQLGGIITATALIIGDVVVIGDLSGNLYGLDQHDGRVRWSMRPDPHPVAALFGSATPVDRDLVIGVSSNEETAAGDPSYPCCSTRGSVVRIDPRTGHVKWQTFMVSDAERAAGASGASVWSTPVLDEVSATLYVTTGNNFSEPSTGTSDAVIALDALTGAFKWVNQRTPDDTWTVRFPPVPPHPDYDFGDSAQLYRLGDGRLVVGAGQKSGFYHVLDARTGQGIQQIQLEPGGPLGGFFADSAVAHGVVYANGINWPGGFGTPPVAGDLVAIAGDASRELWRFTTPGAPDLSGVATAGGVVYFQSDFTGLLFALDADTGALLAQVPIGGSVSGPAIADGQIYVGVGDTFSVGFAGPGAITALGL